MNTYEFATQWTEGEVRDIVSAIVHRDPTLGPMIGSRAIEVILNPSSAAFPDDHDVVMTPASATILVDGREAPRGDKARTATRDLLNAVARASGIRAISVPEDADLARGFGVLWRKPSSDQEANLARAVVEMRTERDAQIAENFKARWCAAA